MESQNREKFQSFTNNKTILYCVNCDIAFEISNSADSREATDHRESADHKNSTKNDRLATIRSKVPAATKETIVFCQRLNDETAFCMRCNVSFPKTARGVERHLDSKKHKTIINNEDEYPNPINETREELLAKHSCCLRTNLDDIRIACIACESKFDGGTVFLLNRHLFSEKHIAIMEQNNDEIFQIPFQYDEEDPFLIRREKFKRNLVMKTAPSNTTECLDVRYFCNRNPKLAGYRFFCMYCNESFSCSQNVGYHIVSGKHVKNTPNAFGKTQKQFEYDVTKLLMASK